MLKRWNEPVETCYWTEDVSDDGDDDEVPTWCKDPSNDEAPAVGEQLKSNQRAELEMLLTKFSDVMKNSPGHTTLTEHQIKTGSSSPIRQPPYRLAHAYRDTVKKKLDEMQRCGVIEPSSSEWASPMVLVKKDGTIRLCVDYRRLNSLSAAALP